MHISRFSSLLGLSSLALILSPLLLANAADELSTYEKTLQDKQIPATQVGLKTYFDSLHPDENYAKKVAELITALGDSESFAAREQANARLLALPKLPHKQLTEALENQDPEIRWRAKDVLEQGGPESRRILNAAFWVVSQNEIQGLIPELLAAIPVCDQSHLVWAATRAIEKTATKDDLAELKKNLSNANVDVQVAAVGALARAAGKDAAADFARLSDAASDQVKLAAARARANYGDRTILPELVKLLSSQEVSVRVQSSLILRNLTHEKINFSAYGKAEDRQKAIAQWSDWVKTKGNAAELHFPLKAGGPYISHLNGNTLLSYGYSNKVAEYDPSGKEIFSYPAQGAWTAEKLSNGNILCAEHTGHKVTQVAMSGKVVWEYPGQYPIAAHPLENGNILITFWSDRRIVEVTPEKKIVWEFKPDQYCYDAQRLENGNTAFTSAGSVRIVTPDKKEVWRYDCSAPYGISPVANGNLLIAQSGGQVVEVTPEKKIVWSHAISTPCDAYRLPNGNTLVTGSSEFQEVTPEGKVVWKKQGGSYGTARR